MKTKNKIVLGIAIALVVFGVITCKVDYTRVKENKEPIFLHQISKYSYWQSNIYRFWL